MAEILNAKGDALLLGQVTPVPDSPDVARLDAVPAPSDNITQMFQTAQNPGLVQNSGTYAVRLSCPEFTSVCPVTGQPDFAHIVIDYIPARSLVESKSLKLFLASFRNHADFHEACTCLIGRRIVAAIEPAWLQVSAFWFPRGGIPIDVFWQYNFPPNRRSPLPPIDIPTYRAR